MSCIHAKVVMLFLVQTTVSVGDLIGWGMLIPASQAEVDDRMVVCYLTINRNVALTRVLFEPPGGLYPAVVLPFSGIQQSLRKKEHKFDLKLH